MSKVSDTWRKNLSLLPRIFNRTNSTKQKSFYVLWFTGLLGESLLLLAESKSTSLLAENHIKLPVSQLVIEAL